MAEYIDKLHIGGNDYDIYAVSATTALNATHADDAAKLQTGRVISASGDAELSNITFNGEEDVTGKISIKSVPTSAISAVAWSAVSSHSNTAITANIDSTATGFAGASATEKALGKILQQVTSINSYIVTAALPTTGESSKIYIVTPSGSSSSDNCEEYVYSNGSWVKIGTTEAKFNDYAKISGAYTAANQLSAYSAVKAGDADTVDGKHATDFATADHEHNYSIKAGEKTYSLSASSVEFDAGNNIALTTAANKITISAKDTTYTTANFITASHLSNIQTASGYAKNWHETSSNFVNQNAYSFINVIRNNGSIATGSASGATSTFALSAGANIDFTTTADAHGNPCITISAKDTPDVDTKYSLSASNGVSANYAANGSVTALKVVGLDATPSAGVTNPTKGVNYASYVTGTTAYIF